MRVRLLILLAASALTGCGSAGAPARTSEAKFTVTLDDYTIRPQVLSVPGAKKLTVTVANHGRLGHTFRLRAPSGRNVLVLTTIRPGESSSKSFRLGRGTYTMYCALANHEELGMNGKFIVR
jgi:plastocyanin